MTLHCPGCGAQNGADFRFCIACGKELLPTEHSSPDETLVVRGPRPAASGPAVSPEPAGDSAESRRPAESAPVSPFDAKAPTDATLVVRTAPGGTPADVPQRRTGAGASLPGHSTPAGVSGVRLPRAVQEQSAGAATSALGAHTARVRVDQTPLRIRPSRLAPEMRQLSMGETVQLQIYTAYFARVRSEDGAEGFIERRHLSQSAGAAPALAAVGMIAFAIASLIAFLGSLFPWLTQYGRSSSEIGWDVGAGKLTLLLALAGGGILAARFRYPGLPEIRFLWGMTGIGALITLLTLIEAASHGNASTEYGLYLTMVAGIGMALAPWLDRWRSLQTLVNPP